MSYASFIPQLPFDTTIYEPDYPIFTKESVFTDFLMDFHGNLAQTPSELERLNKLTTSILESLKILVVNTASFTEGHIQEVCPVGSFRTETLLPEDRSTHIVVVLRAIPTRKTVDALVEYLQPKLISSSQRIEKTAHGLTIIEEKLNIYVSLTSNAVLPDLDPNMYVDSTCQKEALKAVRQCRWFETNASHTTRLFQLLSSGLLLPGSAGIIDPCEPGNARIQSLLIPEQQEEICCTAQTILRLLAIKDYSLAFTCNEDALDYTREKFLGQVSQKCGFDFEWSECLA